MKQIPNYPGYYVTKEGRIWSSKTSKFLKPFLSRGYPMIMFRRNSKKYHCPIHRLVLEAFVGLCPEGMESCHNNGIRTDNRLCNLRWDTRSNNHKDAIKHGTHTGLACGEKSGNVRLTEQNVRMIIYMWRTKEFTQQEIAKVYKIHRTNVSAIINKRTWKHIWRK